MANGDGFVKVPNSLVDKYSHKPEKLGRFAVVARLKYLSGSDVISPRQLARLLQVNPGTAARILREYRDLEKGNESATKAQRADVPGSKAGEESGNDSATNPQQTGNPDLILAFKEEEEDTPKPPKKKKAKVEYPDWLNVELWGQFVANRKAIKKPMTDKAQELAIKKLRQLIDEGDDMTKVLEAAIIGGWQGLFSVKEKNGWVDPYKPKGSEGLKNFKDMDLKDIAF